jgi:hypothetical protein
VAGLLCLFSSPEKAAAQGFLMPDQRERQQSSGRSTREIDGVKGTGRKAGERRESGLMPVGIACPWFNILDV